MKYLVIANVERLEDTDFIVINVFDKTGQLADETIKIFKGYREAVELIQDELYAINQLHFDVWTSDKALFAELLAVPGVAAEIKHRDKTVGTLYNLLQHKDVLIDLYEIQPSDPLPVLPKWRRGLLLWLEKITKLIKGDE